MILPQNLSPELRLLLLCLKAYFGRAEHGEVGALVSGVTCHVSRVRKDGKAAGVEELAGVFGWARFMRLARNHHVLPIVYRALKQASKLASDPRAAPPGAVMAELRDLSLRIAACNVQLTEQLHSIAQLLKSKDIPAVPIKGPVLAQQAYGCISMRQFGDLDLVIPQARLLAAKDLLCAQGFELKRPPAGTNLKAYLRTCQDWILCDARRGAALDIKPSVISHTIARPGLTEDLVRECVPCLMDDLRTINAPTPETMLLIVCMHGAHETWVTLSQVCDVAGLAGRAGLDWDRLLKQAQEWGQLRTLLSGLRLCSDLLGIALPKSVSDGIEADASARRLAEESARDLMSAGHVFSMKSRDTWRQERRTRDNGADRVRALMRQMLTPSALDLNAVRLPGPLYPLYTPVRLFRLAAGALSAGRKKN